MGDPMNPMEPHPNPALLMGQVHRWRTAFLGVVILLAGMAIGIGLVLIWAGRRIPVPPSPNPTGEPRLIATLRDFLRLSDPQVQAIAPIIREHMDNIQRIRKEVRPKVAEELRSLDKRISEQLNKEQRRKWERRFRILQDQLQWQMPPYRGRIQGLKGPIPQQERPGEPREPLPPNQSNNP